MKVNAIRTEQDYEQALRRVEELWASPCHSPERDELLALVTLIEAYEDEHYPIDSPKSAGGDNGPECGHHHPTATGQPDAAGAGWAVSDTERCAHKLCLSKPLGGCLAALIGETLLPSFHKNTEADRPR